MKTKLVRIGVLAIALCVLLVLSTPKSYAAPFFTCTSNVSPSGNWNTAGNWTGCNGTVPQSGDAVVISAGDTITLNTSPTVASLSVSGILNMNGLLLTNRTLTVAGNLTINSGGTIQPNNQFGTNVHTLNVKGNFSNGGTFTTVDSSDSIVVVMNGSVAQTISGSNAPSFQNLTINNTAGVSLTANATVNGVLTLTTDLNTGANTLTLGSAATSAGAGDVIGNVSRTTIANGTTYDFGNGNVELTFTSGTPPTSMVVNLVKGSSPFTGAVSRQYTLTPTGGSGYAATVRLRYLETELGTNVETALNMYRYNSGTSTWDLQAPTTRDSVNNWVEKTGVTTFSPWALGTSSPTAVTLSTFSADGDSNTDVLAFLGLGIGAIIALGGAIIARKKFSR
jgi:hypothetical protein